MAVVDNEEGGTSMHFVGCGWDAGLVSAVEMLDGVDEGRISFVACVGGAASVKVFFAGPHINMYEE